MGWVKRSDPPPSAQTSVVHHMVHSGTLLTEVQRPYMGKIKQGKGTVLGLAMTLQLVEGIQRCGV